MGEFGFEFGVIPYDGENGVVDEGGDGGAGVVGRVRGRGGPTPWKGWVWSTPREGARAGEVGVGGGVGHEGTPGMGLLYLAVGGSASVEGRGRGEGVEVGGACQEGGNPSAASNLAARR